MPRLLLRLLLLWSLLIGTQAGEASNPGPSIEPDPFGFDNGDIELVNLMSEDQCDSDTPPWDVPAVAEEWVDHPSAGTGMVGHEPFIAAKEFTGAKQGYVFKLSKLGLGYYIDLHDDPAVASTVESKEVWPSYLQQLGANRRWGHLVRLCLDVQGLLQPGTP